VHRFGSYLNRLVHFHVLVSDGVFSASTDGAAIFHPALTSANQPGPPQCDPHGRRPRGSSSSTRRSGPTTGRRWTRRRDWATAGTEPANRPHLR
jgi:hypothetical protein